MQSPPCMWPHGHLGPGSLGVSCCPMASPKSPPHPCSLRCLPCTTLGAVWKGHSLVVWPILLELCLPSTPCPGSLTSSHRQVLTLRVLRQEPLRASSLHEPAGLWGTQGSWLVLGLLHFQALSWEAQGASWPKDGRRWEEKDAQAQDRRAVLSYSPQAPCVHCPCSP